MSQKFSKEDIPLHLRGPPADGKQSEEDAKVPPVPCLFRSLIPGTYGSTILPPRMEFGCWIAPERMLEIAEKLGCLIKPVDRQFPGLQVTARVRRELRQKINSNLQMGPELVFTGSPDKTIEFHAIYSFGTNHDLKNFPTKDNLAKLLDMLDLKASDMKWWVSQEKWQWTRVDLKMELLVRRVVDVIMADEWAGVLERADARKRMKDEAQKCQAEEERTALKSRV